MRYTCPNLPVNNVKKLIVSSKLSINSLTSLKNFGIEIISYNGLYSLDPRISHHPDLGICHVGIGVLITAPSIAKSLFIDDMHIISGNTQPIDKYPSDSLYNVCVFGKYAVHDFNITDRVLLNYLEKKYELIHVKQGYSKCSISVVSKDLVITQDKGIEKVLEKHGIDVILIDEKAIKLEGFEHGFIGGASFLYNCDTWMINGCLEKLDSCYNIERELKKKKIDIICLNDDHPADIGSFIPIFEGELSYEEKSQ